MGGKGSGGRSFVERMDILEVFLESKRQVLTYLKDDKIDPVTRRQYALELFKKTAPSFTAGDFKAEIAVSGIVISFNDGTKVEM